MNKSREIFKTIGLYVVFLLIPACLGLVLFHVGVLSNNQICDQNATVSFLIQCMSWSYPLLTIALGPIPAILATVWYIGRLRKISKKDNPDT